MRLRSALAVALVLTSGCATPIVDVVVNADVAHVRVLEGTRTLGAGRPPLTLRLPADVDHDLVVTAEGREARPVRLVSTTSGTRVALLVVQLVVFPVGIVMLPLVISRGVCKTLDPTEIDVTLGPANGAAPSPQPMQAMAPTTSAPATRPPPSAAPTAPRPAPPPASAPAPRPSPPPLAPAPPPARPAFCGSCGARLVTGATFCGGCGVRVGS